MGSVNQFTDIKILLPGNSIWESDRVEIRSRHRFNGPVKRPDRVYPLEGYGDSLLEFSKQPWIPLGVPVHSRLWTGFAGCEGAAEPPRERLDPFRRPKWLSDGGRPLDPSRHLRVGRCAEKRSKIGDQRAQWRHLRRSSSSPARWARALDHGQSSACLTSRATTGLSAT
jgi:hypothetical protein